MKASSACALVAVVFAATLRAQDNRPVAFTNARLVVVDGPVIERGTLVVKDGVIQALGKDATAPAGALTVDCQGGTVMPGLVSALSRAGLSSPPRMPLPDGGGARRGRRGGLPLPNMDLPRSGGVQNQAATKIVERLDAKQDVFGELLRQGVTTLSLTPNGNGFPGYGALLRPDGKTLEQLTADDDALVFIGMARESAAKKLLKDNFDKAKKIVEERKKPKEAPKPPEAKPADKPPEGAKPGDKPAEPPKPGDKTTPKTTEAKATTVKDIMKATHTKEGPLNKVPQAVKNSQWDDASKLVQDLLKAGDDLGKAAAPKKGTMESWAKFVKEYQTEAKAVSDAIGKKDRGAFKDAFDSLNMLCRDCHAKHK